MIPRWRRRAHRWFGSALLGPRLDTRTALLVFAGSLAAGYAGAALLAAAL